MKLLSASNYPEKLESISVGKIFGADLLGFMQAEFSFVLSLMESISAKPSEAIIFLNENSSLL